MNILKSLLGVAFTLSVCLAQIYNISGKVMNEAGTGLPDASIKLEKAGLATTTGTDGSFTISGTVNINGQIGNISPHELSVTITNGFLRINIVERFLVEIISYTLQGKAVFRIQERMDAGTHSIALPHTGAGVYFYRVKSGTSEYVFKSPLISKMQCGTGKISLGSTSSKYIRSIKSYSPINDVIAVVNDGYLNYRVIVTNSDTSGIEVYMIACDGTVTDIDGNVYQTVRIGNQVWTVENLRTTRYNDSTPVTLETSSTAWIRAMSERFCYYYNTTNADSIKKYGALYNWYAVDTKKLAPAGWHVPSDIEWDTLYYYLIDNGYNWDGTTNGNKTAKSLATKADWRISTTPGCIGNDLTSNNKSGFSALPGGYRNFNPGGFYDISIFGVWWSSTERDSSSAYSCKLSYNNELFGWKVFDPKTSGFSVRLVKDN